MIVDYVGVFRNLQKALAIYGTALGEAQPEVSPVHKKAELVSQLREAISGTTDFCIEHNVNPATIQEARGFDRVKLVEDAVAAFVVNDDTRRSYLSRAGYVDNLFKSLLPDIAANEFGPVCKVFRAEMSGVPCAHHTELCIADLMGRIIPMNGQVPIVGGKTAKVEDRRGIVFEERPEAEAFRRWQAGEFVEVERRFARAWRRDLNSVDLLTVAAGMRAMGIDSQTCKSLEEAKILADSFVRSNDRPLDRLKFALYTLGLPLAAEPFIAEQWKNSSFTPLVEYAPFMAHALSVQMFFQIALGANLIAAERPSWPAIQTAIRSGRHLLCWRPAPRQRRL